MHTHTKKQVSYSDQNSFVLVRVGNMRFKIKQRSRLCSVMSSGLNQADVVWDLCVCVCVSRIAVISTIGSDTQVISRHYGLLEGLRWEILGGFGLSLISVCHGCPHANYPPHPACPSHSAVASFCVFLWIVKELHAHTQSAPHLWGVCAYRPVSGGKWVITVHFLPAFPLLSYLQRTATGVYFSIS